MIINYSKKDKGGNMTPKELAVKYGQMLGDLPTWEFEEVAMIIDMANRWDEHMTNPANHCQAARVENCPYARKEIPEITAEWLDVQYKLWRESNNPVDYNRALADAINEKIRG